MLLMRRSRKDSVGPGGGAGGAGAAHRAPTAVRPRALLTAAGIASAPRRDLSLRVAAGTAAWLAVDVQTRQAPGSPRQA